MKITMKILAMMAALLTAMRLSAMAAPGPDGFANVPWGASKVQIEQEMAKQGSRFENERQERDGSLFLSYSGAMAGVYGTVYFYLKKDSFCEGGMEIFTQDGGRRERAAFFAVNPILVAKYGSPHRTIADSEYLWHFWDDLDVPGSTDKIDITIGYTSFKPPQNVIFNVNYNNKSLHKHLLLQNQGK
jgi:hypothetical protein